MQPNLKNCRYAFDRLDVEKDGVISHSDLAKSLGGNQELAKRKMVYLCGGRKDVIVLTFDMFWRCRLKRKVLELLENDAQLTFEAGKDNLARWTWLAPMICGGFESEIKSPSLSYFRDSDLARRLMTNGSVRISVDLVLKYCRNLISFPAAAAAEFGEEEIEQFLNKVAKMLYSKICR